MTHDRINFEKLIKIPWVDPDFGFDISPEIGELVFSWNITGQWEIYILSLTNNYSFRKVTTGCGGKFAPKWRPHERAIAYIKDMDGSENYDIYLWSGELGKDQNLTPDIIGAIAPSFSWSPDGKKISFCSNYEGCFNTYILDLDGEQLTKVLDQPYPDFDAIWSPDGNYLAIVSEAQKQDFWITILPINNIYNQPFIISLDGHPIYAKDPAWSPDSNQIAFSSNIFGSHEIGIFDVSKREISWLTNSPGEKEHPTWLSSDSVVYIMKQGSQSYLAIQRLSDFKVNHHQIEPGVFYAPKIDPVRKRVYLIFDNPRYPNDLWSFLIEQETFEQITFSFPVEFNREMFAMPDEIWYPGYNGDEVPALLYKPQKLKESYGAIYDKKNPPPAVILIHGGPDWLSQYTWDPLIQNMVDRGWVVLAPNYRGSIGYGRVWQYKNRYDFGGGDAFDVAAGADYLIREGLAAPEKIGITGRSWGGYLTAMCLVLFPGKWAVGSAIVPFLNWFTAHENSREDLKHWDLENFGDPEKDFDLWYERSPYFYLDRIQAPVQLICGSNDVRCPASESLLAYQKLKELGKICDYLCFSEEGHSFLKIENQVRSKFEQVNFLAKYLA